MSIPDAIRTNFETLLRAAQNGDLALLECTDATSGETRYVICAVAEDDGVWAITPFGHLVADADPYAAYLPPTAAPFLKN